MSMNVSENVDKREAEVRFDQELLKLHIFSQSCLPEKSRKLIKE
jgi:hypothetical protein